MPTPSARVFIIPSVLAEGALDTIPLTVLKAVQQCNIFFTENERTARRFLKSIWKEMIIDDYLWYTIHKAEPQVKKQFITHLREGKTIGILSEAGCPGVADPGQLLVEAAHAEGAVVTPVVGPSALLLALMASGLNGQQFQFTGYLPIDNGERIKTIRNLETESARKQCTQIFIETPYRNNQLMESMLKTCRPDTLICIACNLTDADEFVQTKMVANWQKMVPDLHKKPVVFLMLAG
jgi:16S rRNA (cytidine1402-2'-O)-methyltransferase